MQMTNDQLIDWVDGQKDKKLLIQCATGLKLSTSGSKKTLQSRIIEHLEKQEAEHFADWEPTMVTSEQNKASLFSSVTAIFALTVLNTILILILGATVILQKDNAGLNRDQIREIVIQANYDTCVADVAELNAVIPDPAQQLDPAATCS